MEVESLLKQDIEKMNSQKVRSLYTKKNITRKEKPTLEGKLALKTAISLESLQNGYIDIHNQIFAQIYEYFEEINAKSTSLMDISLEKIFLQKVIDDLTSYLNEVRKRILSEMNEIIKIFNSKLALIDDQEKIYKEKKDLNSILKKEVIPLEKEYDLKSINVLPIQNSNINESVEYLNNSKKNNEFDFSSPKEFNGYDFDINDFINSNQSIIKEEKPYIQNNKISTDLWDEFLSR